MPAFAIPAIFSSIKFWLVIAAVGAFVTFSYVWVDRTLDKIHDLERKTALLEVSNKAWEEVAKEQRANAEKAVKTLAEREKEFADAGDVKDKIDETLDLDNTDESVLQVTVDRHVEYMRRCLEIASGSPRTEADKENTLCP